MRAFVLFHNSSYRYRSIDQSALFVFANTDCVFYVSCKRTTGSKVAFKYHAKKLHISQRIQRRQKIERKKDIPWGGGGGVD